MLDPKPVQYNFAASASLVPNNLVALTDDDKNILTLFYIHNSVVWQTTIVDGSESHRQFCIFDGPAAIHEIALVKQSGSEPVLVIAGNFLVQFYSLEGEKLGDYVQPESGVEGGNESCAQGMDSFFKGIAATEDAIYVGSSAGDVLKFSTSDFALISQSHIHSSPISYLLTINKDTLLTADESGGVFAIGIGSMEPVAVLVKEASDVPCVCAKVLSDVIVCGFENGSFHAYSGDDYKKLASFSGHGRNVTSMDTISSSVFVSVGADSKAQLWKLKKTHSKETPCQFSLAFTATIKDRVIVGVQALADGGMVLACYDSYKAVRFSKKA